MTNPDKVSNDKIGNWVPSYGSVMSIRELRWSLRNAGRPDCFGYVIDSTRAAQYPRFEVVVECEDEEFAHETHYNLATAERRLAALYAILTGRGWEPCST